MNSQHKQRVIWVFRLKCGHTKCYLGENTLKLETLTDRRPCSVFYPLKKSILLKTEFIRLHYCLKEQGIKVSYIYIL